VKVRIASAGICGSDLHLLGWDLPVVMGHELAGTLADGTPVAVEPIAPCGQCDTCREGDYHHCSVALGGILGVGRDGGMAEQCLVPESALVPLAGGVPLGNGCLVEPLAIAVHGMRRASVRPGDSVAVVGAGSIGLTGAVAAQAAGAEVDVEARHEHQREAARRLGARAVPSDGESRYDVVVEAAGTGDALARAVTLARPGGRILVLGTYWDRVDLPAVELCMKEIDLVPSSMYGRVGPLRDIDAAAALLAGRPEVADVVITHRFPLDAAAEAFATAKDRSAGAIKVVIEP
jgi:threonine dehydrogenase-like Zn-dependent dehydrogenase